MVGGLLLGGLAYLVDRFVYVAVLLPLGMAYGGSLVIDWAVTRGKVRNPLVAASSGLLIGILMFSIYHYARYFDFRLELSAYISYQYDDQLQGLGFAERAATIEQWIDRMLLDETGAAGFWGYLRLTARAGIRLAWWFGSLRDFTVDFGSDLNPVLAWAYRVLELVTVAGLTFVGAIVAAGRPYCESCDEWWGGTQHFCPGTRDWAQVIADTTADQAPVYAGFWPRCGATLIDAALLVLGTVFVGSHLWALLSVVLVLFTGNTGTAFATGSEASVVAMPIVIWLYCAALESSSRQATLGKMVLRLAVTDVNGDQLSFARASMRFWAKLLSVLPLGCGLLLTEMSDKKQALHDVIAGSVVVKTGG